MLRRVIENYLYKAITFIRHKIDNTYFFICRGIKRDFWIIITSRKHGKRLKKHTQFSKIQRKTTVLFGPSGI